MRLLLLFRLRDAVAAADAAAVVVRRCSRSNEARAPRRTLFKRTVRIMNAGNFAQRRK